MEYGILGPLRVSDGGRMVDIPGVKERAALGLLVVEANTVVSSDRMIFELWGDDAPRDARAALRTHISRLRKALGVDRIVSYKPGYVLEVDPESTDVARFERLADRSRELRHDPDRAAVTSRRALAEWRGPVLADLASFSFVDAEAQRLEQRRLEVLELAIHAELETGRHEQVVAELAALTAEHPFHERFWALLMLALYRSDRAGDALEVFGRAETTLAEGLGIGPSAALRSLERAIVLQDPDLVTPVVGTPNNLPFAVTSFVGRHREMHALEEALDRTRIVTLTGVGGSGKSRLALELASRVLKSYPDGVWRVELASLRDPEAVAVAVAMALGEPASHATDPIQSLIDYLADRRVFLLLDNCEHLLAACAALADRLSQRCPHLTLLATSREPLRVPGETVWLVPPLTLPDPVDPPDRQEDAEAFQLFQQRAAYASPSFAVSDDNRDDITRLCRDLAGLPLALELAAARCAAFTPRQLVERLSEGLDILAVGSAAADRSRTMRGSLEWSYRLLGPRLARTFRRLAVFVGGWSMVDAQSVVGEAGEDTGAEVAALIDKSLVTVVPDSPGRYRLLEPVREYAKEVLSDSVEADEIRARHAAHYLNLAEEADRELRGPDQMRWLAIMQANHDNLRSAIGWALESHQGGLALEMVAACAWFWFMAGHWRESWAWLAKALEEAADSAPRERARALYTAGGMQVIRANASAVLEGIEQALVTCRRSGDRFGEAWCLHLLGHAALMDPSGDAQAKLSQAREIFVELDRPWEVAWSDRYLGDLLGIVGQGRRGVELQLSSVSAFREMGDRWSTAYGLYNVASLMNQLPEFGPDKARPYLVRCLRIANEIGDHVWAAHAIRSLAESAYLTGSAEAEPLLRDAISRLQLLGDETCLSTSLGLLGDLQRIGGYWAAAAENLAEGLRIRRRLESRLGMAVMLIRLGLLADAAGHRDEAARLAAAVHAEVSGWDTRVPHAIRDQYRQLVAAVAGVATEEPAEDVEDIVPYALELAEMIRQGDLGG